MNNKVIATSRLPEAITEDRLIYKGKKNRQHIYEFSSNIAEIPNKLFLNNTVITDVHIPEWITHIGDYAFKGCTGLTTLSLPEGLKSIGRGSFWACPKLTNFDFPESLKSIGNDGFCGCYHLTTLFLPEGLKGIGARAFFGCKKLTTLFLPESLESIGKASFWAYTGLKEITLPENLKSIGDNPFNECTNLKLIIAPQHLVAQIKKQVSNSCTVISHQEYNRKNCQRQWLRAIINASHTMRSSILTQKHIIKWERYTSRPYLALGVEEVSSEEGTCEQKNKIIPKAKGPAHELFVFFAKYPGLKKLIGSMLVSYFNPYSAGNFGPTDYFQAQKSQHQRPLTTLEPKAAPECYGLITLSLPESSLESIKDYQHHWSNP